MGRAWLDNVPARRWTVVLDGGREIRGDLCGFYVFFDVPEGRHVLTLRNRQGDDLKSVEIVVEPGRVTERDFVLWSGSANTSGLVAY